MGGRGTCRLATPNRNHTASSQRLDIEPGSFIYTVKVTSKFLRLERLLVQDSCGLRGGQAAAGGGEDRPSHLGTQVALPRMGAWPNPTCSGHHPS